MNFLIYFGPIIVVSASYLFILMAYDRLSKKKA
jgi:hypothetical protein